ncbi:MAG: DUF4307 domain-containing protein [Actinobacteria bacterium]|nr:DUF4307 domain-containing protein [Actinomycetota bacterium]MBI3685854.1 DUF4307 domain-containing protein [Actinomycetota bacterium]
MSTPLPAGRYGGRARPRPSRRTMAVLGVLVVLAGLGVAYLGYRNLGSPTISGRVVSYRPLAPDRLAVRFTVTRAHPDRAARCVLRGRAGNGVEVGLTEYPVPAGPQDTTLSVDLTTTRPLAAADVYSCRYTE